MISFPENAAISETSKIVEYRATMRMLLVSLELLTELPEAILTGGRTIPANLKDRLAIFKRADRVLNELLASEITSVGVKPRKRIEVTHGFSEKFRTDEDRGLAIPLTFANARSGLVEIFGGISLPDENDRSKRLANRHLTSRLTIFEKIDNPLKDKKVIFRNHTGLKVEDELSVGWFSFYLGAFSLKQDDLVTLSNFFNAPRFQELAAKTDQAFEGMVNLMPLRRDNKTVSLASMI